MPSSQSKSNRRPIKIGSSTYWAEGSFGCGNWTADGESAMTLDGLHEKLSRRARQRTEAAAKAKMRRGNSKPDSATGTGRKWFS